MSELYEDDFDDYTDDFDTYDSDHHDSPNAIHKVIHDVNPKLARPATVRAPKGFFVGTDPIPTHQSKPSYTRWTTISKLITFHAVSYDILNIEPKSRYEMSLISSIRNHASGHHIQPKETQTGTDLIDTAIATEDYTCSAKQVQCPDDLDVPNSILSVSMNQSTGNNNTSNKKRNNKLSLLNKDCAWTPQLNRFVLAAVPVFECLINHSSDLMVDQVDDPNAGLVQFGAPYVTPNDHSIQAIHVSTSTQPNLIAISSSDRTNQLDQSIIHVYSIQQVTPTTKPQFTLATWGIVSCIRICSNPRWLIVAGTCNGTLLAWDIRRFKHGPVSTISTYPVYTSVMSQFLSSSNTTTTGEPIHSCKIIDLHVHAEDSIVLAVDEFGAVSVWGLSLHPSIGLVPITVPAFDLGLKSTSRHGFKSGGFGDQIPSYFVSNKHNSSFTGLLVGGTGFVYRVPEHVLYGQHSPFDMDILILPFHNDVVTCMVMIDNTWIGVGLNTGKVGVYHLTGGGGSSKPLVTWTAIMNDTGVMFGPMQGIASIRGIQARVIENKINAEEHPHTKSLQFRVVTDWYMAQWVTHPGEWGMDHYTMMQLFPNQPHRSIKPSFDSIQFINNSKMVVCSKEDEVRLFKYYYS